MNNFSLLVITKKLEHFCTNDISEYKTSDSNVFQIFNKKAADLSNIKIDISNTNIKNITIL
tara:strand:+ start:9762 stop:9944 length:183 start_codon:yes stop_codon:yes gene_type:complete